MPVARRYARPSRYVARRPTYSGRGAYYPRRAMSAIAPYRRVVRRPSVRGHGAYYVSGGIYGSAGYGPLKAGAAFNAGYGKGNTSKIPPIKGLGAYSVRKNVFLTGDPPSIQNTNWKMGGVVIRHREYIGDVISSSSANTFQVSSYALNPGLSATFPWLAQVAANFEEYEVSGMLFEFKTMSSDALNSTNTALGEVVMATQYNAANPPFNNIQSMLNYEFAESIKPSTSCIHMIECDPHQSVLTKLYVRNGSVPASADVRLYDFGVFSIATNGMQGTSVNVGQLWVTYEFIFYKPLLPASIGLGYYHLASNSATYGVASATPLGTSLPVNIGILAGAGGGLATSNNLAISIDVANQRINFPVFDGDAIYDVQLSWTSTGAATAVTPPTYGFTNCSALTVNKTNTAQSFNNYPANGESVTKMFAWMTVKVNAQASAYISVGTAGTIVNTPLYFNLIVIGTNQLLTNASS